MLIYSVGACLHSGYCEPDMNEYMSGGSNSAEHTESIDRASAVTMMMVMMMMQLPLEVKTKPQSMTPDAQSL